MKNLVLFLIVLSLISCNASREKKVAEYSVELKIKSVKFYSNTIRFEPPQVVQVKPNSDEITEIELGNGTRFGVKYYVSELKTGSDIKLMHNAAFFDEVQGDWRNINAIEHREPFNLNEEKDWGIGVSNEGEAYFKIDFSYRVIEI